MAWDTLAMTPTRGVPAFTIFAMDIPFMERLAGCAAGEYGRDPEAVYLAFQREAGACFVDQWIPRNPLTMGEHGYESSTPRTATTAASEVIRDGIVIDSPEAVIEHLERVVFPRRQQQIDTFAEQMPALCERLVEQELAVQRFLGPDLLKGPYADGFQDLPKLHYGTYGYANYFMAYALYPEIMERDFVQQADLAVLRNRAAARVIVEGHLPRQVRLDHDMA